MRARVFADRRSPSVTLQLGLSGGEVAGLAESFASNDTSDVLDELVGEIREAVLAQHEKTGGKA